LARQRPRPVDREHGVAATAIARGAVRVDVEIVPARRERVPVAQRPARLEGGTHLRRRDEHVPRVAQTGVEFGHLLFIGSKGAGVPDQSAVGVIECVILVGVPGAGKTSLYRQRFEPTHVRIEDKRRLDTALASGASVVVDNTNPRRADRAPLIAAAQARGARVVGYYFDVTTRAAVARNAVRTGKDKVPNV